MPGVLLAGKKMPHIPIVANNSGSVWHPTAYQGCLLPYGISPSNSLGLAFVFIRKESHPTLCGESRGLFRYGSLRLPFRLTLPRTSPFVGGGWLLSTSSKTYGWMQSLKTSRLTMSLSSNRTTIIVGLTTVKVRIRRCWLWDRFSVIGMGLIATSSIGM